MDLVLPMPPSVNSMYRRTRNSYGMYKTAEAKEWVKICGKIIRQSGIKRRLKGKIDVELYFYFKIDCDLDNRLKALFDCLQDNLVIENDKQIYSILAIKGFDKKNPRVELNIRKNE